MKRGAGDDDGSLDLLLDTICNAFGGVVFIAISVILMLNRTSKEVTMSPPTAETQAELTEWQQRVAQSDSELNKLRTAIKLQTETEQRIIDPEALEIIKKMRRSQSKRADALSKKSKSVAEIGKNQAEVNQIAEAVKKMKETMEQSKRTLIVAERQLKQEIKTRTRSAKLPKMRETTKDQVVFFLQDGKLTSYSAITSGGELTDNPSEYLQSQDKKGTYIQPKKGVGLTINPDGSNGQLVHKRISEFSNRKHYVTVFIWPDSFSEFAILQDVLVRNNFEYSPNPVPKDERIYIGASRGKRLVQ